MVSFGCSRPAILFPKNNPDARRWRNTFQSTYGKLGMSHEILVENAQDDRVAPLELQCLYVARLEDFVSGMGRIRALNPKGLGEH